MHVGALLHNDNMVVSQVGRLCLSPGKRSACNAIYLLALSIVQALMCCPLTVISCKALIPTGVVRPLSEALAMHSYTDHAWLTLMYVPILSPRSQRLPETILPHVVRSGTFRR